MNGETLDESVICYKDNITLPRDIFIVSSVYTKFWAGYSKSKNRNKIILTFVLDIYNELNCSNFELKGGQDKLSHIPLKKLKL